MAGSLLDQGERLVLGVAGQNICAHLSMEQPDMIEFTKLEVLARQRGGDVLANDRHMYEQRI